jgi:hypothetical protein
MPAALAALLVDLLPWLVNMLRVMLYVHAGKIIIGILGFLGLDLVAQHYVITPMLDTIRGMMTTGPGGSFGTMAMQWMGILRVDQAVSMMLSAWTITQGIKQGKVILSKVTS